MNRWKFILGVVKVTGKQQRDCKLSILIPDDWIKHQLNYGQTSPPRIKQNFPNCSTPWDNGAYTEKKKNGILFVPSWEQLCNMDTSQDSLSKDPDFNFSVCLVLLFCCNPFAVNRTQEKVDTWSKPFWTDNFAKMLCRIPWKIGINSK